MGVRFWNQEEKEYLYENWGKTSLPTMSKRLNRSIEAIKLKAAREGMDNFLNSGDYITFNQLLIALGCKGSTTWYREKFTKLGLPFYNQKRVNKSVRVVKIKEFWKWIEKNKDVISFKNFEEYTLGDEPSWVKEKRKADIVAARYKRTPWTKEEDALLKSLLSHYRFGYKEISQKLNRTEGAIKRRVCDLGLKARPVKAYNHTKWTQQEIDYVVNMHKKGYTVDVIASRLDVRSAQAVRGTLERMGLI